MSSSMARSTVPQWDAVAFRRDLHAHPELAFEEHRTSEKVASLLQSAGLEVRRGIGVTGLVATLRSGSSDRGIALRADMDALPMDEETGLAYGSTRPGVFHGCGHDGHTTMLVGAALHLAKTRSFDGSVHFIFQPAEEGRAGARAMIEGGLFEVVPAGSVFALHNWPELPAGTMATKDGAIMAAADRFEISLSGTGGHAAQPHLCHDVLATAGQLIVALNAIVSRRIDPAEMAVLSVTRIEGGRSHNVLPGRVSLTGTVRSFDETVRDRVEQELRRVVAGLAAAAAIEAHVDYVRYYPATLNDPHCAEIALRAARRAGLQAVSTDRPSFAAEDFAFMLRQRPGAYVWLGQGRGGDEPALHHPRYDFNDAVIPHGIAWFASLVEQELAP